MARYLLWHPLSIETKNIHRKSEGKCSKFIKLKSSYKFSVLCIWKFQSIIYLQCSFHFHHTVEWPSQPYTPMFSPIFPSSFYPRDWKFFNSLRRTKSNCVKCIQWQLQEWECHSICSLCEISNIKFISVCCDYTLTCT